MLGWFKENINAIKARVSTFSQKQIPGIASSFCSNEDKKMLKVF